jgi:hypothetical protein
MLASGRPRILVAHSADWFGVARLPRLFSKLGFDVTLLDRGGTLASKSRYVSQHIPAEDRFVDALRQAVSAQRYAFVCLADDPLINAVAAHAGERWLDNCFPVNHRDPEKVRLITSKFAFLEAAKAANIPVPQSRISDNLADLLAFAKMLGYPVVAKADAGTSGSGVRLCEDERRLTEAFEELAGDGNDRRIEVEEFIRGSVGTTRVLYHQGDVAASDSSLTLKQVYVNGPPCIRQTVVLPEVDRIVRDVGRLTGFTGIACICWMKAGDRIVMLELNPRPGSSMQLTSGPILTAFQQLFKAPDPEVFPPAVVGRAYRMFPQDVDRVLDQRDIPGIAKWLLFPVDVPWDEPALLRAQTFNMLYKHMPATMERIAELKRGALHRPARAR